MRGIIVAFACLIAAGTGSDGAVQPTGSTRVVMLGTGTPRPDPERWGPATAVVVGDAAYIVDAGAGVVRRAAAAAAKGIDALAPARLNTLFLTHLHSDHTVGLPDLILSPWVQGRSQPLHILGPVGTEDMVRHVLQAWRADIEIRTRGLEQRGPLEVDPRDVKAGVVLEEPQVTVTAFQNAHGQWAETYGYKFETADRTIVISGDTSPSDALIAACRKCDVLIHEVYSERYTPADMPNWIEYRAKYHTTTAQLADIANRTLPKLLILYHRGGGPAAEYLADIGRTYRGRVVDAEDLAVY